MARKRTRDPPAARPKRGPVIVDSGSDDEEFPVGSLDSTAGLADSEVSDASDFGEEYSADEADLADIFIDDEASEGEERSPSEASDEELSSEEDEDNNDASDEELSSEEDEDNNDASDSQEEFVTAPGSPDDGSASETLESSDPDDDSSSETDQRPHPKDSQKLIQADKAQRRAFWDEHVQQNKILPEIIADYDSDSSTEDTGNTVGNVPMEWYDDYPHIGYDIDGKRVLKPATRDELDKFLSNADDPDAWTTVPNTLSQTDVKLTDEELQIIKRLQGGLFPDAGYDPYEPQVEFFSSKVSEHPLPQPTEPKRRFLPSKWEAQKIRKMVAAIRSGRIILKRPKVHKPRFYPIWNASEEGEKVRGIQEHLAAPKLRLPGHALSYRPPKEYIPTPEELAALPADQKDAAFMANLPRDHPSLRQVPAYPRFVEERYQRCLDLYLCPRMVKRPQKDLESLVPKLPDPRDLRPFPNTLSVTYDGHTARIRSISIDPTGLWLLSGADDKTVRLWEITTGRCAKVWALDDVVYSVAWNPNPDLCLFAVAVGDKVLLMAPPENTVCDGNTYTITREFLARGHELPAEADLGSADEAEAGSDGEVAPLNDPDASDRVKGFAKWVKPTLRHLRLNIHILVQHRRAVRQVVWHHKGDYFATVCPMGSGNVQSGSTVLIHMLSKHRTQRPFQTTKGPVQKVVFHPIAPHLIVATQRYVRIYDLMRQSPTRTLQSGAQWISSVAVHPQGDNVIIGTYDRKLSWFDLDLGGTPYKTIKFHSQAIRQVCFHRRFPLFASASDDGTLQVFHSMVYQDLIKNPLIVPVKILRGHRVEDDLGVLGCEFHPVQPWLFSCGADATIRLWT
ncbi:Ribosome biogenesis protein erb1 [Dimargaris cristalligena]|nr:Ribosome biogenesis protein erb1 [Dimargaris cristalligena]